MTRERWTGTGRSCASVPGLAGREAAAGAPVAGFHNQTLVVLAVG